MSGTLLLFSSALELAAVFPEGAEHDEMIAIAGVGPIDAALGTLRACELHRPSRVIFVGTCGAHRASGIAIGEVVVSRAATIGSGDVARGQMRLPGLLASRIDCDTALLAGLAGAARPVTVSSTLGITESDELAGLLWNSGSGEVENMETFPVIRAAGDIPAVAVLGVTNLVGPGGGADWRKNYGEMMRAACAVAQTVTGKQSR